MVDQRQVQTPLICPYHRVLVTAVPLLLAPTLFFPYLVSSVVVNSGLISEPNNHSFPALEPVAGAPLSLS
jgi:hypothetical protein